MKSWVKGGMESGEHSWGGVEFRKGLMGTMIAGMSPRSRTGGGRDLA